MTTIDLTVEKSRCANAIKRAKDRNIVIPTYAQMKDPSRIPANVKEESKGIGLWDIHPRNLFRINWHNEPAASGGTYGGVNYLELPPSLTGVPARIIALVGKWFPTGARNVRGLAPTPHFRPARPDIGISHIMNRGGFAQLQVSFAPPRVRSRAGRVPSRGPR